LLYNGARLSWFISLNIFFKFLFEVVERDCRACTLNEEDAMDRSRWRKLTEDDQDGCEWVNVSSGTDPPG